MAHDGAYEDFEYRKEGKKQVGCAMDLVYNTGQVPDVTLLRGQIPKAEFWREEIDGNS